MNCNLKPPGSPGPAAGRQKARQQQKVQSITSFANTDPLLAQFLPALPDELEFMNATTRASRRDDMIPFVRDLFTVEIRALVVLPPRNEDFCPFTNPPALRMGRICDVCRRPLCRKTGHSDICVQQAFETPGFGLADPKNPRKSGRIPLIAEKRTAS